MKEGVGGGPLHLDVQGLTSQEACSSVSSTRSTRELVEVPVSDV